MPGVWLIRAVLISGAWLSSTEAISETFMGRWSIESITRDFNCFNVIGCEFKNISLL